MFEPYSKQLGSGVLHTGRGAVLPNARARAGYAYTLRSWPLAERNPGIKLLGFKDRSELAFEDNVKHSQFIYPDEAVRTS
jgi:ATP-dependent DNA helicase 2 subunit 1